VRCGPTAERAPRDRGGSPVIVLSLVLVIAAAVLLVLGIFFQDGLLLIYLSIGSCLLAMALLGAGVLLRRRETATGGAATASATASAGGTAVRGRSIGEPRALPEDGADRDDTVQIRPVPKAVLREPAGSEAGSSHETGSSDVRGSATDPAPGGAAAPTAGDALRRPAKRAVVKKAVVRKQTAAPAAPTTTTPSGPTAGSTAIGDPSAAAPVKKVAAKKATASAAPVKRATTTRASAPTTSTEGGRSLDDVKGLGPARRQALLDHFGSEEAVRDASIEELTQVRGVGDALARSIKEALG
jgi:DNA uptake protein ComE-like DNA-binding protein